MRMVRIAGQLMASCEERKMTALVDAKTAGHAIAASCDSLSCESKGSEVERLPGLMQYMPLRCTKLLPCPA